MATTAPLSRSSLVLTQSKVLRIATLIVFYFTQGFPVGLFFYAVPTWMAINGMGTEETAAVVATSALPWSAKFVNGFLIDRYTFLPMGRRRIWIIGAQALIVLALLVGALISPSYDDIFMLSAIGFAANAAVTFQDVGIDSLAVDIMPENERAKAAGVMGGAQLIGISATTALGGYLLANHGISACLVGIAIIPALAMVYGIVLREREGERRMPWSAGESHPRNHDIQVEAWAPLLINAFKAIIVPLSLVLLPILIFRSLPWGGFEAFHPVLYTQTGGWELTEYTNFTSTLIFIMGVFGLVLGGWIVDKIGAQNAIRFALVVGAAILAAMGAGQALWSENWVLVSFLTIMEFIQIFYFIGMIAICMRICNPAVAATQFTIYMAVGNFGRPLGASLAAATSGAGEPQLFYWSLAGLWAAGAVIAFIVRFPAENREQHEVAEELPQGEGPAARVD